MARSKAAETAILADAMARVQGDLEEEGAGPATPAELKRRERQQQLAQEAEHKAALAKVPAKAVVCYTPLEDGDKVMTIFHGVKFIANKPVETSNRELILKASTNPWFTVNGKGTKRKTPAPRDEEELALSGGLPAGIKDEQMVELEEVADA